VLASLVLLARAPVELAEAQVAVGDERPHAEFFGESQAFSTPGLPGLDIRGIATHGDVAEKVEGPRFHATDAPVACELECTRGEIVRRAEPADGEAHLTEQQKYFAKTKHPLTIGLLGWCAVREHGL